MTPADPEALNVAFLVLDVLEEAGCRYQLGGSYASSVHGVPRQTHDVDVVADLDAVQGARLASALEGAFYVDREMIEQAIERRASFNLVHLASGVKVDVFVKGRGPFDEEELARSVEVPLGVAGRHVPVKSAEDIILRKLEWFRRGGEVSDRQWSDVLEVVRTQGDELDRVYLEESAPLLGVSDLLEEVLREARG